MRTYNTETFNLLKSNPSAQYTANKIVRLTGRSFATVRDTLNRMLAAGLVERDPDISLNGKTIYQWYWIGAEL